MENQQIIFMHIPKTAGRTLRSIIERNYPKDKIIRTYSEEQIEKLKTLTEEESNKFKFIIGHNYFGMHEFLNGPFSYITMLRDPVERVISLYYFILNEPGTPMYQRYHDKEFIDFLKEEPQTINWQTRFAAGGELDLEKAKDNLKKYFSVVGISERFDESLALISKECQLKNLKYKNVNVTPNRPKKEQFPPQIIKKIQQNVAMDIELYEYALKLFEEKLKD